MSDKSQKTEKPTPQRLKEARRDGQIARTHELSAWVAVLVFTVVVPSAVRGLVTLFRTLVAELEHVVVDPDPAIALGVLRTAAVDSLRMLAPLLAAMVFAAVASNAVQGGLRVFPKRFKPKFETLNPAKGLKNLVGAQAAWTLVKTLVKFVAFGVVAFVVVRGVAEQVTNTGQRSLAASVAVTADAAVSVLRNVAILGLVLAAADYVFERHKIGKSLRMSLEEIKRENRMSEGDPYQKGVLRGRQRELSRNRMMADVATAQVVIVNPTHVAVALAYESGRGAPRVVAKGAGVIAARIREEAERHKLPMVQDVPLARTLYKSCQVGQEVPAELYDAVAGVFVFVMGLRRRGSAAGLHRNPQFI
jgi:flagellar biosynthetic protein FlhB